MINLKAAGCTQLTLKEGGNTDWLITLDGEELYSLPEKFTVQDTLLVRKIAEKLVLRAYTEGMIEMARIKDIELEQLLQVGNSQLDFLISNNKELSAALERHAISNQQDY